MRAGAYKHMFMVCCYYIINISVVEVNIGGYRDAKCRGIYLALFTDPEGDACLSIYQISWIKMKKATF